MRPQGQSIRYRVDPRDVPAEKAARRLHLSLSEFRAKLPELTARGFPTADTTTGMFDLVAIDEWMSARHTSGQSSNPGALTGAGVARNASEVSGERIRRLLNGQ